MVTKYYNLSKKELENWEIYGYFAAKYSNKIKEASTHPQIFDINNTAVIISLITQEKINKKQTNNLTLIGTERLINKTIKEIKMNGFKLEEIITK
mgnify:CR=1 FL=1